MRSVLLVISHLFMGFAGFAAGIYLLPILTAPAAPSELAMAQATSAAEFQGEFQRDLAGSDFLHWGEGRLFVGPAMISLQGRIAPGPDYKLYLSPELVETEEEFEQLKPRMVRVGDVKTFENFVVSVPVGVNPADFKAAIVWCEAFGEFITAAAYQ